MRAQAWEVWEQPTTPPGASSTPPTWGFGSGEASLPEARRTLRLGGLGSPPRAGHILLVYAGPSLCASVCRSFFSRPLQSRGPHSFPRPLPFPPRVPARRAAAMLMRARGRGPAGRGWGRQGRSRREGRRGSLTLGRRGESRGSCWGNQRGEAGGAAVAGVAGQCVCGGDSQGVGAGSHKGRIFVFKTSGGHSGPVGRGRPRTRKVHGTRAQWAAPPPLRAARRKHPPARGARGRDQLSSPFCGPSLGPAPPTAPPARTGHCCAWSSSAPHAGGDLSGHPRPTPGLGGWTPEAATVRGAP